ncbi:hypothetical protein MMC13_008346 [Lambiella insularis]|nr:hypothetical protein [Lambiella insularis]
MFLDLPPINDDYEDSSWHHIYSDRLHTGRSAAFVEFSDRNINSRRLNNAFASDSYFQLEDPHRLPTEYGQEFLRNGVSWQHYHCHDWEVNHVRYDSIDQWAPPFASPEKVFPIPCSGGRFASENGSWSDRSIWTPGASPDRSGLDTGNPAPFHVSRTVFFSPQRGRAQSLVPHGRSPSLSEASLHDSIHCSSGITLQDVQQYPDAYQEDPFVQRSQSNDKSQCHLAEPSESPAGDETRNDRLGTTLMDRSYINTQMLQERRESPVKDESISDVENESCCSEYSPARRSKSGNGRSTRERRSSIAITKRTKGISSKRKPQTTAISVTKRSSKASSVKPGSLSISEKISYTLCLHCKEALPTKAALNKHITTVHTRPFTCTFRMYGCLATFGSKNEWKRHVSSQHLRLGIWRCDLGSCLPRQSAHEETEETEPVYNEFNRKDLFTQHLRRMHAPPPSCSHLEKIAFTTALEAASKRCLKDIRSPPPYSTCGYCPLGPSGGEVVFEGAGSWEARMEHVGRHLESGHGELQQWKEDRALRKWMVEEELVEELKDGTLLLVGLPVEETTHKRANN